MIDSLQARSSELFSAIRRTKEAARRSKVDVVEARTSRLSHAADWYLQAVDAVPLNGWNGATLCAGWTPTHVVAHVATGDQLTRGIVFDALGKSRAGQELPIDFADRQRRFQQSLSMEPSALKNMAHKESAETVATVLEAVEKMPDSVVTMPAGQVPMRAVRTLRLNEYIIHGHDLSPAIGRSIPIPDWFVEHALADTMGLLTRLHQRSPHKGKAASFHIHRTDGEGEWTLRIENGQAAVESGHGKADAAMRGPAEGLYWVILGRGSPEEQGVEVHGDPALAGAFKEWFPGP
jgi:uncharacterized protein (TIGR03083 family)